MSFIGPYDSKEGKDALTKVTSLAQHALKDNQADQEATGLRVTKTPTHNDDVVRKQDLLNGRNLISPGTGNLTTTPLQFTIARSNLPLGQYEWEVTIKKSGGIYKASGIMNYEAEAQANANVYISPIFYFDGANSNASAIRPASTNGLYFVLIGSDPNNIQIRFIKTGNGDALAGGDGNIVCRVRKIL